MTTTPTAAAEQGRSPWRPLVAVALASAAFSVGVAIWTLRNGHPHEDAFILFCYAENLVREGTISYFPGGPPAEGATDFLWMLSIAALHALHLDVALAAALLNALGAAVLGVLLAMRLRGHGPVWLLCVAPWVAVASQPAQAGYGGFSALFFSSLCLLTLHAQQRACEGAPAGRVTWLGLLLGLVRPDGVIVGVGATLATAFRIRARLRPLLWHAVAAAVCGAGYFAWRVWYFGEWLPLPLYVKSWAPNRGAGLVSDARWLLSMLPWLTFALLGIWKRPELLSRAAYVAVGPGLLLLALAFSHPAQNHAFRFQAPATVLLMWLAMDGLSWLARRPRGGGLALAVGLALPLLQGHGLGRALDHLTTPHYINTFPQAWAKQVPGQPVVALTEAGRLSYWTRWPAHDLVGLNTVETARSPVDAAYLERLDPDIVMLHLARTLPPSRGAPEVVTTSGAALRDELLEPVATSFVTDLAPDQRAAVAGIRYLARHDADYRVFRVRYFGQLNHVYGLRHERIDAEAFEALVRRHQKPTADLSYWALKGL